MNGSSPGTSLRESGPPASTGESSECTTAELIALGRGAGLSAVGVTTADVLEPARTVIEHRKAAGLAGTMQFTYRNPTRSTDPTRRLPSARSLVVAAWPYPADDQPRPGPLAGRVARYARQDHYSRLEQALVPVAERLRAAGHRAQVLADSNHLVDRNVAWRAGLGWYGKSANLLLPGQGSWFVLGSVLTDARLEPTGPPVVDGCGRCSRCLDDCPTGAIVAPGVVDSTRCLAWLVQAGEPIPVELRPAVADRIYGCDDCQEVCPPNHTRQRGEAEVTVGIATGDQWVDLLWLLSADDEEILASHGRWYIAGRDVDVIRRTALVALGNTATPGGGSVPDVLRRFLIHRNPLLRAHALWAARRLGLAERLADHVVDDDMIAAERQVAVEPRFVAADWDGGGSGT